MKADWIVQLREHFGEDLAQDFPLSTLTTLKVGGIARGYLAVKNKEDLKRALRITFLAQVPVLVVGAGANLIVPDEGFKGLVIQLRGDFEAMRVTRKTAAAGYFRSGAGVRVGDLLKAAARAGLSGLEPLAGIPATVGGAVRMNAGIPGFSISDVLVSVTGLRPDGTEERLSIRRLHPAYRDMGLPAGWIVLSATFRLAPATETAIREEMKRHLKRRAGQTWRRYPNAGSIFKNPPQEPAGRLIEACGLKGTRIGGAQISPDHANVIINRGNATARDVLALIDLVRERVRNKTGVALKLEVVVAGN